MAQNNGRAIELVETDEFQRWIRRLRDESAHDRINARLARLRRGHLGDVRPVGDGVSEMRINYGPGYRIYFVREGMTIVVLLCGGDKDSQTRDIRLAKRMAAEWRADNG